MNARLAAALADRYRIERELGQGGMATVYLARDLRHDRDVAIKVLREDLAASLGGGRFLREIKIAAQLQHPNILPLLDSGEADGFLFFVMPYVRGQSLRDRLAREGELPVHEALRLITEVVDALATAHAEGVVHRDIKPDNVMLSGRHALVTDFGVAKAVSEATGRNTITTIGVALGTPAYMSPEQAAADPHVDHRSDIYSVGVMAYEMLCGRPPFTGSTPQQVLAAHMTEAPEPPSARRDAISPALDQVILTCLAKRAADRYQTADELLAALEPLATPSTGITPAATRPMAPMRRRRWWIGAGAAAVAIAAVALVWRHRAAAPSAPVTLDRMQLTTSGYASNPVVSPDGKQVVYTEQPCDPGGPKCIQRLVVEDVASGAKQPLVDSAASVSAVAWSPTGEWIIVQLLRPGQGNPSTFAIISHLGGTPVWLSGAASFTGHGDTVLVETNWLLKAGQPAYLRSYVPPWTQPMDSVVLQRPADAFSLRSLRVSPTGRWIAANWDLVGQRGSVLTIHDRQGRRVASRTVGRWAPVWNAAGTALLHGISVRGQGAVARIRVDPRTGALGTTDTIGISTRDWEPALSVSADGSVMTYDDGSAGASQLWTLAATGSERVPQRRRMVISGASLADGRITPDGATVIYATETAAGSQTEVQYAAVPFAGGAPHAVTPPLRGLVGARITSDSRHLIVGTRATGANSLLTSYDLATGRPTATAQVADTRYFLRPAGAGDVAVVTGSRITIFDDLLRELRRIVLPDSLGRINGAFGSARGPGLGLFIEPPDPSPLVRSDGNYHTPVDTVTASGGVRPAWTMAITRGSGFWWEDDGSLLWLGSTAADPVTAVYRSPPGGGPQERLGPVPVSNATNFDFSADGKRGVATVTPYVSNIWLLKNFAPAMR
jgi:dipeptidyl aminopeptidase/acylaminoacyl peptidase